MNTSSTRFWGFAGLAAAVLMIAVTWLLVIGPARSSTATLRDDTANVQQQNVVLMAKNTKLREVADNRAQLEADVRSALTALPSDASLPDLNRQLSERAAARGVELSSISVGAAGAPVAVSGGAAPAGMLAIPVTLQTKGRALSQLYFLRDLQEVGPRAALVSSTSLSAIDNGDVATDATMTTQLTVFSSALAPGDLDLLTAALGDLSSTD